LDQFPAARAAFTQDFGSLEIEIREFTATHGKYVDIVNLEQQRPALFQPA